MSFFKNQVEHLTDQVFLLNLLAFFVCVELFLVLSALNYQEYFLI